MPDQNFLQLRTSLLFNFNVSAWKWRTLCRKKFQALNSSSQTATSIKSWKLVKVWTFKFTKYAHNMRLEFRHLVLEGVWCSGHQTYIFKMYRKERVLREGFMVDWKWECIKLHKFNGEKILENYNLKLDVNREKCQSEPLLEAVGKQNEKIFVDNRKNCNGGVIAIM